LNIQCAVNSLVSTINQASTAVLLQLVNSLENSTPGELIALMRKKNHVINSHNIMSMLSTAVLINDTNVNSLESMVLRKVNSFD
jgi:hypothetical protein